MREQLIEGYMFDRPGAEGIYLALWFDVEPWDTADGRRARCAATSRDAVRERLLSQAAELTSQGAAVSAALIDASYHRPS